MGFYGIRLMIPSTMALLMTICFIIGHITSLWECSIPYIINAPACVMSTLFHISVITVECLWSLWIFDAQRRPTYYSPLFIIDWLDVCLLLSEAGVLFSFCPCVCVGLRVCLSVCSKNEKKILIKNCSNLVVIYVVVNPVSDLILVTFDLDLWPWELKKQVCAS